MDLRLTTSTLTHSPLFVGLLGFLLLGLGLNSSFWRVKLKIYRGDGGNSLMGAAERAHGNTVEHALLLMILLVVLELMGVSKSSIATLGTLAVLVRVLRAAGMLSKLLPGGVPAFMKPVGMTGVAGTYLLEGAMAVWLVMRSLERMG